MAEPRSSMFHPHRSIPGLLALLLLLPACLAAETVLLRGGRALEAERAVFTESGVRIERDGGAFLLPHEAVEAVLTAPLPTGDREAPAVRSGLENVRRALRAAAHRHGVDPLLAAAVVQVESNWNPHAVSHAGACGLMQLLPETARDYGIDDLFDPDANLEAGLRHLRRLLDRYDHELPLALAAYNAGEGRVDRYGGIPPFPETRTYVRRVTDLVSAWREGSAPVQ